MDQVTHCNFTQSRCLVSSLGGRIPLDVHEPGINADFISFMFGNALRLFVYKMPCTHTWWQVLHGNK